jgi:hypothetical protein
MSTGAADHREAFWRAGPIKACGQRPVLGKKAKPGSEPSPGIRTKVIDSAEEAGANPKSKNF